jgi:uncharacterized protein (TIGR02246 family)
MSNSSRLRLNRLACLTLWLMVLGVPAPAWSGPKEDVAATTARWAEVFADDNPDAILAMYDQEARLWGTLSPKLRDTPELIRDYMVAAFKALPGHKVSFGEQEIRVYGDTAINTGYYTFSFVKDGEPKSLPARYSFTYVKRGDKWMIVDHHSSVLPAPPK